MSATATSMYDFIEAVSRRVPRDLHPFAQAYVAEQITNMLEAADDPARVVQLISKVNARIADELRWEATKYATVHDFREAHRLRRQADRFEHA